MEKMLKLSSCYKLGEAFVTEFFFTEVSSSPCCGVATASRIFGPYQQPLFSVFLALMSVVLAKTT